MKKDLGVHTPLKPRTIGLEAHVLVLPSTMSKTFYKRKMLRPFRDDENKDFFLPCTINKNALCSNIMKT